MAAIDRLGWAAGFTFRSLGVAVGVRTTDPSLLPALLARRPHGWRPAAPAKLDDVFSFVGGGPGRAGVRRFHVVYEGAAQLAREREAEAALEAYEAGLRVCVAARARRRVVLHAGVVGWKGCAILLPGDSHAGQSTLVAALVRAGADYYSDEYAVLDHRGRVHPHGGPLSLRDDPELGTGTFAVERLPGRAARRSLPVGLIAITRYRPGARWRPRSLAPGFAALELSAHSFSARRQPRAVLDALACVTASARTLVGTRGEAVVTAGAILDAVGAP
jgi:hypothetical protein